ADDAGRERRRARRVERDVAHRGEPGLEARVQRVDPCCDSRAAERALECEGLRERPAVLERVEAARRERARGRARVAERRDRRLEGLPAALARPDDPGPARAEKPFVAARAEDVAAKVGQADVLDAEAVDG